MTSSVPFSEFFRSRIAQLKEQGLYRQLRRLGGGIDLCSNDYLGFARESLRAPNDRKWEALPSGATGSRLISGNVEMFEEIEQEISTFHGSAAALVFSSGYLANLATLSALPRRHDTVIYDQLIHASLRDGIRLSGARAFSFRHNDLEDLRKKLEKASGGILVVVESLYSMDGDRAPLKDIIGMTESFGASVIVDEAHSVGVDGPGGRGLVSELGLENRVLARTVTFGKALGCHGAAVLGDALLQEYLINSARGFIFTTAVAPRCLLDIQDAYRALPLAEQRRSQLRHLSHYLRKRLELAPTAQWSPIHQIRISGNQHVVQVADDLRRIGIDVVAIRSPTVPEGAERLRICLHSFNTEVEIDAFCDSLESMYPRWREEIS